MSTLFAFHGDAVLKQALLVEIAKHEAADAIIKGTYAARGSTLRDGFRGCAIGCALHSLNLLNGAYCPTPKSVSDHTRFPRELGIPIELAYHIDTVFENLPDAESRTWLRRVIDAIPVGANLDLVISAVLQWMILDPTQGFIALTKPEFHATYRQLSVLVDRDWKSESSVSLAEWEAIDTALTTCPVWARAGARAWAGARARARAGAWAGVWAWARAWGVTGAYSRLSEETLRLLATSKAPESPS